MKLLIVSHYFPSSRSGLELAAGNVASRLVDLGWHVTWAASDLSPPPEGPIVSLSMKTWNGTERWAGFSYPIWSPASLARLARAVRDADAVHIHDTLYFGNLAAFRLARWHRKPVVVTQHISPIPHSNPVTRALHWVADRSVGRHLMAGADRAVFPAQRLIRYYSKHVRFRNAPRFIPHGVDTTMFLPARDDVQRAAIRARFGLSMERPVLLFVGRFVEKKGLHVIRQVADRMSGWDFLFAGKGPLDPTGWGLQNVRVAGSLPPEALPPLYQAADLLLLPSVGEAFPLVIQEAMACGTSALISDETATGCPGIERWAFVCPPDVDSVLSTVRNALSDPVDMVRRRSMVVEHARREWHWDRCVSEYAALFEELVGTTTLDRSDDEQSKRETTWQSGLVAARRG